MRNAGVRFPWVAANSHPLLIFCFIRLEYGKDGVTMDGGVQIKDKFCLTIDEASEYFNIGEKKLRQIASENLDSGFVIQNGVKVLIKRKRFETFLEELSAI